METISAVTTIGLTATSTVADKPDAFLFAFAAVNVIALLQCSNQRWIFSFGIAGACIAGIVLVGRLIMETPVALDLLATIGLIAIFGRPWINRWTARQHEKEDSK